MPSPPFAESTAPRDCDLLLTGGHVLTPDPESIGRTVSHEDGSVAVDAGRIVAVGSATALRGAFRARRSVDCTGMAVLPGFTDAHTHLFQSLARGLGEGMAIWPWLREFMWPYAIAVTAQDARVAARLGAAEAARAGITTVVDHHYAPTDTETVLAVAEAIEETGLRGVVARGMLGDRTAVAEARGLPTALYRYSTAEELRITAECLAARPAGSRVQVWPAPLNLSYGDQDLVSGAVEQARRADVRWHTHCSEGAKDPASYLDAYGIRPVAWLEKEGLLDERATLAHAVWLDEEEIAAVGARGASVAHNPGSNAYLASGTMPLAALRAAGATVALGTDGPCAGGRQDMFEVMKQMLFTQRLATLDPASVRCGDALTAATLGGARYTGSVPGTGRVTPGAPADLAVVDVSSTARHTPLHRLDSHLVHTAQSSDVVMTIVAGEVVFEDSRCTRIDEEELYAHAREHAVALTRRADLTDHTFQGAPTC
ncbi:amidohydrolase family protein [Streptomyces sp. NPDC060322]|uniref:amidohydrolase family protein n=1 Tax=Streptomyces sp. NPDC060322 TaxID=3347097 RepID=UPI003658E0E5